MNNQAAQTMPEPVTASMCPSSDYAKGWNDCLAALSRTAGVAEPNGKLVGWWNGIMPDVTERSPYGPSVRCGADAEDSAHDIPLYDGYNPIHYRQPDALAAAPATSGGEARRVWQCPACPSSVEYAGKVAPPCPRCDTTTELDPIAKPSPPAAASVSERARSLLADAFRDHGYPRAAESLEAGFTDSLDECALAAIEQALTQQRGEAVARVIFTNRKKPDVEWLTDTVKRDTLLYTTPQPSADAVRELVRRWRDEAERIAAQEEHANSPEDYAGFLDAKTDELESLISGGSHA